MTAIMMTIIIIILMKPRYVRYFKIKFVAVLNNKIVNVSKSFLQLVECNTTKF
jgi:hypothetical protein